MMLPPEALAYTAAMKASGQEIKATGGPSVASEKEALEAQGKYYKQGEGPPLEELGDAWTGFFMWTKGDKGTVLKCSAIGHDGYYETARCAIEMAMTCRFDKAELPHKGGLLTAAAAGQNFYAKRMIQSGIKFKMGGDWFGEKEFSPPVR